MLHFQGGVTELNVLLHVVIQYWKRRKVVACIIQKGNSFKFTGKFCCILLVENRNMLRCLGLIEFKSIIQIAFSFED